ncbi:MAG: hypothetical protein HY584_03585 [Candidatus Omnitrophica bacterium]|nr:hypothetical protein [Candidatus Omnitrophota bacterium]
MRRRIEADATPVEGAEAVRNLMRVSQVVNQTEQKKRLIIPLARLSDPEFREEFFEVLNRRGRDPNLEFAILATGFELKAEREVLALLRGRNIFVEFNVQLFGRERFGQDMKSETALMNRMIQEMREEVGLKEQEFSTRVVAVGDIKLLKRMGRGNTPTLLAKKGAFKAALLLFDLEGAVNWFEIAPDGFIDPTEKLIQLLEQSIRTQFEFTRAA